MRPLPYLRHLALLSLLLSGAAARAQDGIITDRPDFTESPFVVPQGRLQAELGATYEHTEGTDAVSGPELLLRWAPLRRLEIRLVTPDYVVSSASGFTDPTLGVKVALGTAAGWSFGTLASVLIPLGDSTQGGSGLDPALVVTASRDLTDRFELGTQVGATYDTAAERVSLAATLVAGRSLTDRLGTFLELAADGLESDPALTLHHGYTYGLSPDVQLDVHAGAGLTAGAPDFLVGVGLSVRR